LAFIYETTVDPEGDSSHAATLDIVGHNKRVLEVGCATGYFTKALKDRGCEVVAIEMDPDAAAIAEKWAERVVVGDLDDGTLWQELEGEQFDAITFGDVLEHLRDPLATMRAAVHNLKSSGIVAVSVPNIAHGDVRIALLKGEFPYHDTGLLDRTHIQFFTKRNLENLIREAGLFPVETRRIVKPLFQTELEIKRDDVAQSTINSILEDPEAETYQFVVKAVQDNGTRTLATLADRVNELADRAHDEVVRTALLRKEIAEQERARQDLQHDLDRSKRALQRAQDELQAARHESELYRQQAEAILRTKTFRMLSPLRRVYGRVRRGPSEAPPRNVT
jgi:2-polyprenyl-3-methyl-5-hydroxy-6-metoxy-1,4-benzoquinol methylase